MRCRIFTVFSMISAFRHRLSLTTMCARSASQRKTKHSGRRYQSVLHAVKMPSALMGPVVSEVQIVAASSAVRTAVEDSVGLALGWTNVRPDCVSVSHSAT